MMEGKRIHCRCRATASLTVEAAFVVPLLLGIVFVILYTLLLLHDRVLLQENGCRALWDMMEGTLEADRDDMEDRVVENLWIVQVKKVTVSQKRDKISAAVVGRVRWNIPVMNLFMNNTQEIQWSQKISCTHPEEVKRIVPGGNLGEAEKGGGSERS